MATYDIASELSLQVLERRKSKGELRAPVLDQRNRLLVAPVVLPCEPQIVVQVRDEDEERLAGA